MTQHTNNPQQVFKVTIEANLSEQLATIVNTFCLEVNAVARVSAVTAVCDYATNQRRAAVCVAAAAGNNPFLRRRTRRWLQIVLISLLTCDAVVPHIFAAYAASTNSHR